MIFHRFFLAESEFVHDLKFDFFLFERLPPFTTAQTPHHLSTPPPPPPIYLSNTYLHRPRTPSYSPPIPSPSYPHLPPLPPTTPALPTHPITYPHHLSNPPALPHLASPPPPPKKLSAFLKHFNVVCWATFVFFSCLF